MACLTSKLSYFVQVFICKSIKIMMFPGIFVAGLTERATQLWIIGKILHRLGQLVGVLRLDTDSCIRYRKYYCYKLSGLINNCVIFDIFFATTLGTLAFKSFIRQAL